jgi:hypothetical protein
VVSATDATPAAVEAAGSAACECVRATSITSRAVVKAVTSPGVPNSTAIAYSAAIAGPAVSTATVAAATVATATPVAVIPGAGADEEATEEPARAIEAVGRASVGIIAVIPPRTDRSRVTVVSVSTTISVSTTNPDAYTYLGVSRSRHQRCGNHQRAEQQEIS